MESQAGLLQDNKLPPAEDRQRWQLLTRAAFTFGGINIIYMAMVWYLMPGFTAAKFVGVVSAIALLSVGFVARARKYYRQCGMLLVGLVLFMGVGAGVTTGGVEGHIAPLLIIAPMPAAIFLGWRETLGSMYLVVLSFIFLLILDQNGFVSSLAYPAGSERIVGTVSLVAASFCCGVGIAYFAHEAQGRIASLIQTHKTLIEMTQQLDHSAHHDPLTGLANRKKFQADFASMLEDPELGSERLSLLHIDLDKFKQVNDTHGHVVGDGVLMAVADIMRSHFRNDDLIARIGGDEFIIVKRLSPEDTAARLQETCDALVGRLKKPILIDGARCQLGASIGYVYAPPAGTRKETIIANTDIALYEAKRAGRSVAVKYNTLMRHKFEDRIKTVAGIDAALNDDRVDCVLQPQVSLSTGELVGAEALCRVHDPEFGLCLPDYFFRVAEEAGVVDRVDWLVMKRALKGLSEIRASGIDLPSISINVSAKSLRSSSFTPRLHAAILTYGLTPRDVVVEVLENVIIDDQMDEAVITIRKLRVLGIRVVIDDFGTGQTSLGNLAKLDIDGLKIDRSLVPDQPGSRSHKLAQSAAFIANSLGVPSVFEGIETPEQYAMIRDMGCDHAQGFFIGRPMPIDAFILWRKSYGRSPVHTMHDQLQGLMDAS